jgi:ubiquinone/menaquinone biosynthesis C-methylase UbiE
VILPGKLNYYLPRKIKSYLKNILPAEAAYDIWAENYDNQPNNLMFYYDNIILTDLIYKINLKQKVILDYGCGTGRNWQKLLEYNPERLIGCDISKQMLDKLNYKYGNAETHVIKNDGLPFPDNKFVDIIISTLVIAHVKNIKNAFSEWNRVLKNSASIIITDFHPGLLAAGGLRTFKYKDSSITIKNTIHRVKEIENLLSAFGFKSVNLIEKKIEPDVKHFYELGNALHIYEKFKGIPFIYGILLSRQNAD